MNKELIFLVILDDTPEMNNALRYALKEAREAMVEWHYCVTFDTLEFSHWKAVEDIAEAESRELNQKMT